MNVLVLGILTVLPGSWIIFGLPLGELNLRTRLALSAALSPAVLAIELFAMRLIGIDFAHAAPIALIVNLPAGFPLVRRLWRSSHLNLSPALVFGSLLFLVLAGSLILPWLFIPGYRLFSWHSFIHTDVIYELTRFKWWPEEPELAGLTLAYDWVGEIYWAVLGWLTSWSPTSMYPVTNLIWLFLAFILAYELGVTGLHLHSSSALFGIGLMFLSNQIFGVTTWLVANDTNQWEWVFGTVQNTALLLGYQGFEDTPFVIALLLGLALVCLVSMERKVRFLSVLMVALMVSIGLIYPILFPMASVLSGGTIFLLATRWAKDVPHYKTTELLLLIGGFVLSILMFWGFLALVTRDRANPTFHLLQEGRWSRGLQAFTALLPMALLAAPVVIKSFLNRHGPTMVLAATGSFLVGLYLFANVSFLENKFVAASAIAIAPLSAVGTDQLFRRLNGARWALVLAVPLLLAVLNYKYWYQLGAAVPTNLGNAPRLIENSFWLALAPGEEDMGWTRAVRESTPSDTVVVVRKSGIHLAPFIARSLYLPSDFEDGANTSYKVSPAGYTVDKEVYLLEQRGYPKNIWEERLQVVESLYNEADPAKLTALIRTLRQLDRPVAIRFPGENVPALAWLRHENLGLQLFSDGANIVWFIDR